MGSICVCFFFFEVILLWKICFFFSCESEGWPRSVLFFNLGNSSIYPRFYWVDLVLGFQILRFVCVYTFLSSVSCEIVIGGVVFNATFGSFLGFCEGFSSTTSNFLFPRKSVFFFPSRFYWCFRVLFSRGQVPTIHGN